MGSRKMQFGLNIVNVSLYIYLLYATLALYILILISFSFSPLSGNFNDSNNGGLLVILVNNPFIHSNRPITHSHTHTHTTAC